MEGLDMQPCQYHILHLQIYSIPKFNLGGGRKPYSNERHEMHRRLCFIFQAYVLWGESRKVTIFLSLLTLGLVTGITVVMAFDTVHRQSVNPGIPDAFLSSLSFTRCVIMASKEEPSTMEMIYAIVLATGTIVTTMITWSRARRYRGTTSHILLLLHRNSVIYFVLNLCVALPIFSIGTRVEFIQPALGHCGCAISSVVASRMILALKACNDQTTTTILSPIWFKQVFSASSGDSEDSGIAYRRESLSNASSIV